MITVVLPTFNAEKYLDNLLNSLSIQSIEYDLIVIDSESNDNTLDILLANNIKAFSISSKDFNHGGTRNIGIDLSENEIIVFITQDIILKDENSLERLVNPLFDDDSIVITYGRQIPHKNATPFGAFLRYYNYQLDSIIKYRGALDDTGFKTYFLSNSFAAYKKSFLLSIGKFPSKVIMGEDAYAGAKAILQNYKIKYVADSEIFHSHNYTILEEFKRYFDIGVFHESEKWIITKFSKAEAEGFKFVKEELLFLIKNHNYHLIPLQLVRTAAKLIGYKLGLNHTVIPLLIKRKLSMHEKYWDL